MGPSPLAEAPRARSAVELKRLIELDRLGEPYLVHRDADGAQVEIELVGRTELSVGRDEACDLALPHDGAVSRLHAELIRRAGAWTVVDDGLSKNGTFVNAERVLGRRRLRDGDVVAFGATAVLFRNPRAEAATGTSALTGHVAAVAVSPAQRRVLVELCRPYAGGARDAFPATNREIAARLFLSDEAVKSHMRALFQRFGIEQLPQNAKRARLVELAMRAGIVTPRELATDAPAG